MNQSRITKPAPWDRISFLSKIFFTWPWALFFIGNKRDIQFEDLYQCPKDDESKKVADDLERNWNRELQSSKKPSLTKAIFRTYVPQFFPFFLAFTFQECVVSISQPLFLGMVLRYFENPDQGITRQNAIFYAVGIIGMMALYVSLNYFCFASSLRIGQRIRVACCTLMYRKSVKLSRSAIAQTAVGQIVNIMSNDVNRFDELSLSVHSIIVSVVQTTLIMIILWQHLGWACLSGIAVLILFVPFQGLMGRMFQAIRRKTSLLTDNRIRLMNEIITGIKVIKMYTWEKPFVEKVGLARKIEINRIQQASYLRALNLTMYFMASKVILFACFVTYVSLGGKFSSESIFVSMAYFNMMQITVGRRFPNSISAYAESYVTCKRIEKFLLLDEIRKRPPPLTLKINGDKIEKPTKTEITVEDATARWNMEMPKPTFERLNFKVNSGELLVIIGSVGSGKSSVLMSLLNELSLESGNINIQGKISYSPQEAWAFVGTVRENILFGAPFDEARYAETIRVCALQRDMELFPHGDQTIVGERGVSLSGGQKTRVTLARAIYNEADIYLLDDPLSAVDTHVAKHIFQKCIVEHLHAKTRVLVTHQLQYLQLADKILILKDGQMISYGTYSELKEMGINFQMFVSEKKEEKTKSQKIELMRHRTISWSPSVNSTESEMSMADVVEFEESKTTKQIENTKMNTDQPIIQDEIKKSGRVGWEVYWQYIKSSTSPYMAFVALISMVLSQCLIQGSDVWITEWTKKVAANQTVKIKLKKPYIIDLYSIDTNSTDFFVLVYSALMAAMFVIAIVRTLSFFTICMRSSVNLHNSIFSNVLSTRVSHFDQNPSGRILNRFSKDTGIVDESLPGIGFEAQVTGTTILGSLLVNAYTNYYLIIPGIVLGFFAYLLSRFYMSTARDLKRLEGMARSPIYSHVNNTLSGLTTIRSFQVENIFVKQFSAYINDHSATYWLNICVPRTLGMSMDWLCIFYVTSIVVFVFTVPGIPSGYAGLAISSSMILRGLMQIAVRNVADVESYMTSVERMLEYTKLEKEENETVKRNYKQDKTWPQTGTIKFDDVTMYYDGVSTPVLKNISCKIEAGTKVGVVGRTGAGKSSLISALFRLCRRQLGSIQIDGVDISKLPLDVLRSKISIIPQEPLIFTGTVRYNVDPFGEHDDERLWRVLDEVQLKETISNLPGQLGSVINEGGTNFSVGQRQLICLARAILRDNNILVLDEATANVDNRTDELIQRTIRKRFAHCTVITIAHRLHTIIDSDRIVVLDAGRLVEYGAPYELLRQPDGHFTSLVEQTGKRMSKKLIYIAQQSWYGHKVSEDVEEGDEDDNL
ncbi:hypothetical protein RDWZM_006384 [Blomia tropicalis]|uniref:Uncharacterized protein n=1 Tax=Blomia tropicalis TaxID=40697 RepID=A0A9Q0M9J7_BLOTA|nr:hypothetical protein RDWZM_006384 [Blomia tropicalis]